MSSMWKAIKEAVIKTVFPFIRHTQLLSLVSGLVFYLVSVNVEYQHEIWLVNQHTWTQFLHESRDPSRSDLCFLVLFVMVGLGIPLIEIFFWTAIFSRRVHVQEAHQQLQDDGWKLPLRDFIIIVASWNIGLSSAILFGMSYAELGRRLMTIPPPDFVHRCLGSIDVQPTFDSQGTIQCPNNPDFHKMLDGAVSLKTTVAFSIGVYLTAALAWTFILNRNHKFRLTEPQTVAEYLWWGFLWICSAAFWTPMGMALLYAGREVSEGRYSLASEVTSAFIGTLMGLLSFILTTHHVKKYCDEHVLLKPMPVLRR